MRDAAGIGASNRVERMEDVLGDAQVGLGKVQPHKQGGLIGLSSRITELIPLFLDHIEVPEF